MPQLRRHQTLEGGSGSIVKTTTTTTPILVPDGHKHLVWTIENDANLSLESGEEVDFHLQTTYNEGRDWEAIANIHWSNSEDGTAPTHHVLFDGNVFTSAANIVPDTTAADDAVVDRPIGEQLRIHILFTNGGTIDYRSGVLTWR